MESKIKLYENDSSSDEFIKLIKERLVISKKSELHKFCSLEQGDGRLFQGFINEYFYKGNKEPFEKFSSELGNFIKNKEMGVKFLLWFSKYFGCLMFCDYLNDLDKLPEKNRIYLKNSKDLFELGISPKSLQNFYRALKLNECSLEEIDEINKIMSRLFSFWSEFAEKLCDSFFKALDKKELAFNNEFLRLIGMCFDTKYRRLLFNGNNSKRKADSIFDSYLCRERINDYEVRPTKEKIDFEFFLMAKEIFRPSNSAMEELVFCFDKKMSLEQFYSYSDIFLNQNITKRDKLKDIIKNLIDVEEFDSDINRVTQTFEYLKDYCRYGDDELLKDFKAKSKDKLLGCLYSIENANVRKILFDSELVSNDKFSSLLKKLLNKLNQKLKNKTSKINDKELYYIYDETKESLSKRKIDDKEINDLLDEFSHELPDITGEMKSVLKYRSDDSNDEFIDALDKKLRSDNNFFLYNDHGYRAEKFENRIFQGIINKCFCDGNKEPFKKLSSQLKNFIKDKDMGIKFLCWFYGYLIKLDDKCLDKLPEKNRVRYKNMAELGIDFNSLLDFYRSLKLNDCSLDEIKKIRKAMIDIVGLDINDNINLLNDFSKAIENKNHALDNEFLRLFYISFRPESTCNVIYENRDKFVNVIESYLDKDQKINFEFWVLAKEIFCQSNEGIKELMNHFDNKMPLDAFYKYYFRFLKPDITPKEQVEQIINNLNVGEKEINERSFYCSAIVEAENLLRSYNDEELIKKLKLKTKDKILSLHYFIENPDDRKVLFDSELISDDKFKPLLKKLLIEFKGYRESSKNHAGVENEKLWAIYCEAKESLSKRKIDDEEINNLLDEFGRNAASYLIDLIEKFNLLSVKTMGDDENNNFKIELNEKAEYHICKYLERLKTKDSEAYITFFSRLDSVLVNLKKIIDGTDINALKDVENIKEMLNHYVEIIPCSEEEKNKIRKAISNVKLLKGKEFAIEVIKSVFYIMILILAPIGIIKLFDLSAKRRLRTPFSQIKSQIEKQKIKHLPHEKNEKMGASWFKYFM